MKTSDGMGEWVNKRKVFKIYQFAPAVIVGPNQDTSILLFYFYILYFLIFLATCHLGRQTTPPRYECLELSQPQLGIFSMYVIIIGKIQHISESESWKFFWNKIENNAW